MNVVLSLNCIFMSNGVTIHVLLLAYRLGLKSDFLKSYKLHRLYLGTNNSIW